MTLKRRTVSTSILHMRNEGLCRVNKSPKTAGLGNSRLGPGTWSVCLQILVFSHECCRCKLLRSSVITMNHLGVAPEKIPIPHFVHLDLFSRETSLSRMGGQHVHCSKSSMPGLSAHLCLFLPVRKTHG